MHVKSQWMILLLIAALAALAVSVAAGCGGDDDDDDDSSNSDDAAADDDSDDDAGDDDTDDDMDDDTDDDTGDDDTGNMVQGCDVTIPAGNIVANASFETPDAGASWTPLAADATIGEWTVTDEGVDLMGTIMTAGEGDQCVDLNNLAPGGVEQTLATTAGTAYTLTFCYSGNPSTGGFFGVKETEVFWGETSLGTFTFDTTGMTAADPGWVTYTVDIDAALTTGASTKIKFLSLSDDQGAYGPAIDAVIVTPVE